MCDEKKYFTFRNFSFANKTTLFGLCNQQKRQKSNCRFTKWNGSFKNIACVDRPLGQINFLNKGRPKVSVKTSCWERNILQWRSVLGPKRLIYFFLNNIFYLKRNCVLRTPKNSFAIFLAWRTYIHTHIHTRLGLVNSLKGSYLKRLKCKPLGN